MSTHTRSGSRQRISACLIVRDEARHLPGCLESVRDWVDEIVVVDTGSTDGTPDLARRAGARVFTATWEGDFSGVRNIALDRATGDWILSIDADERLDYAGGARLGRALADAGDELEAYQICIVSAAGGFDTGVELVHFYPRLFRRRANIRFRGALHEQIQRDGQPLLTAYPAHDITLFHLGYADPDRNRVRQRRNYAIARAEAARNPVDPTARWKLADTCVLVGDYAAAEELYRGLLEEDLGEARANVRWNLAACCFQAGALHAALAQLDEAEAEAPERVGTPFIRVQLLMEAGRHAEALKQLEELLGREPQRERLHADLRLDPALLVTLRGVCLRQLGQAEEALRAFDLAVSEEPRLFAAHWHRAELLMEMGQAEKALDGYLRAASSRPDIGNARLRAGLILLDMGRRADGEAIIREAARLDPGAAPRAALILTRLNTEGAGHSLVEWERGLPPKPARSPDSEAADSAPAGGQAVLDLADSTPAGDQAVLDLGAVEEPAPAEGPPAGVAPPEPIVELLSPGEPILELDATESAAESRLEVPIEEPEPAHAIVEEPPPERAAELPGEPIELETPEDLAARLLPDIERHAAESPDDAGCFYELGAAYQALGDLDRAERALREALRKPVHPLDGATVSDVLGRVAHMALVRGHLTQAGHEAKRALELNPDAVLARFVLASVAYRGHRFEDAAEGYRRVLAAGERAESAGLDRSEVARELGVCLYRAERHAEAAEAFAAAAAERPADALCRLFLGNALARLGRLAPALEALNEALSIDPDLREARRNMEMIALDLAQRHLAAGEPARALEVLPEKTADREILFLAAVAHFDVADYAGARQVLEALLSVDDRLAEAHWNLALTCRELGDVAAARAALKRFRQLAPGDPRGRALDGVLTGAE